MYAVSTYAEVEAQEKLLAEKHIIILLFVRPSLPGANNIIDEFNYIHHNSGKYCSVYAVGYSNDPENRDKSDYRSVRGTGRANWYYSDKVFIEFRDKLEKRIKWRYSGDIELIILQSNPEGRSILNFENYLCVDINYGIKNEYIESFPRFMESLIRASRKEVETDRVMDQMQAANFNVKDVLLSSIGECKKIPAPVKKIIRDRLFFRTKKSYS